MRGHSMRAQLKLQHPMRMMQQKDKHYKFCRILISCISEPRRHVLVSAPLAPARVYILQAVPSLPGKARAAMPVALRHAHRNASPNQKML